MDMLVLLSGLSIPCLLRLFALLLFLIFPISVFNEITAARLLALSLSLSLPLVNSYKNIHTHYYTAPAMHCTFVIFLFTQLSLLSTPTFQKYNFLSETRSLAMKVTATMKTLEERLAVCERKL